jgi:hypothetical protein
MAAPPAAEMHPPYVCALTKLGGLARVARAPGNLVFSSPPPIPASIEIANPYLVALPYDVGTPAKAKEASPPPPPKEEEEGTWLQVSENAYGAFIVEAMFNGIGSAIVSTLPMLAASVLAQACFALYIYGIARDFCPSSDYGAADVWDCLAEISLQNENNMCDTCGAPIQFVALMVYLVMLFNNVAGMYTHLEIVFNSHDHKYDEKMELDYDGDADPMYVALSLYFCAPGSLPACPLVPWITANPRAIACHNIMYSPIVCVCVRARARVYATTNPYIYIKYLFIHMYHTFSDLGFPERCLVFVLAVASEMVVWVAMLISGILFVFQSTSNEEVHIRIYGDVSGLTWDILWVSR